MGDSIRKYSINFQDNYIIYIPWHFPLQEDPTISGASQIAEEAFKKQHPSIYAHLLRFKDKLLNRNTAETGIRYEWYALQRFASDYCKDFEKPKIVYGQFQIAPHFSFSPSTLYFGSNHYMIVHDDVYFLLYLCTVLNSNIYFYYMKSCSGVLGDADSGGRLISQKSHMLKFPIRRISFSTPEPERARLVAELKGLYESRKFDQILASVEACLPKDAEGNFVTAQEKSDVVHDLLAFLAEQMLEMNKQKQQEIKGFLGWLEDEVGAKVEDLTPKTKIQEYYKLQFDELLAILKKNKRKLAIDPARREPQEQLRAEFDASVEKLQSLMERIAATDALIDQVVYKLYGLTEEEIGIVKGNVIGKA